MAEDVVFSEGRLITAGGRVLSGVIDTDETIEGDDNSALPTGPAGGDLAGTYPNPTYAPESIVNADVAPGAAIAASKLDLTGYQTRVDRLVVGAGALGLTFGTPAAGQAGSGAAIQAAWLFADAAANIVGAEVQLPGHWLTYKLSARWVRSAATSANVVIQGSWGHAGPGEALSGTSGSTLTVATAATTTEIKMTELGTDIAADPAEPEKITFARLGADAADTFTGSLVLLSLVLDRVT